MKLLAVLGTIVFFVAALAAMPMVMAKGHPTLGFIGMIGCVLIAVGCFSAAMHEPKAVTVPRWGRGAAQK